jgi:hypothetical protein
MERPDYLGIFTSGRLARISVLHKLSAVDNSLLPLLVIRMSKRFLFCSSALALAIVLMSLTGCSKPAVTGMVTLNGTPLEKGQITFQPVEQDKRPEGAAIVNGKYTVSGLAAGKYKVNVVSTVATGGSQSMDDKPKPQPDPIPPGTKGNDAVVEITGSNQKHDITLTTGK